MTKNPKKAAGAADADEPQAEGAGTQESAVWGYAEVAGEIGVKPATIRYYWSQKRHLLPRPDALVGGKPLWYPATVRKWAKNRLGTGYRSDLKSPDA
ncbi:MarR family transcriptional regulator [Streptomyces diastaticus]|uniref:MarR family transcriptional regulator n=1 Tax=Streptomyces diastaticus TaxID=1956 RepID=UPI0034112B1B